MDLCIKLWALVCLKFHIEFGAIGPRESQCARKDSINQSILENNTPKTIE